MSKRLEQTLVVDLESTCWEGAPPADQVSDIIEIGICPIDVAACERLEKHSILVRPLRSEISPFCTQLTTLTAAHLEGAGTLADACRTLKRDFHSGDRLWASWGDYDRRQFERVCREQQIGYPFGVGHLNVKTLFAVAFGLEREIGLSEAYDFLGMQMEGTHHRGDDDAWNIAAILCLLLQRIRQGTPPQSG